MPDEEEDQDVPPGDEVEALTDSAALIEDEDVVDSELRKELALSFQKRPEMPFADFLNIALYNPRWGYYNRRRDILGAKGDFQTAPHVHPLFGWTIARAVQREFEKQGRPKLFTVVEIGPGAAYLMDDLWSYLKQIGQDTTGWRVALVERSESLRKVQEERLLGRVRAQWFQDLPSVGEFTGVVIANEFLDALPFHRVVRRGGSWKELCVVARDPNARELAWKECELTRPELAGLLPRTAPQGTILEESVAATEWIRTLASTMTRGLALFFDYGSLQEDLVEDHPEGTLQTFAHHRAGRDPFEKLGSRDITAWVDFSPIMAAAEGAGLEVAGVRSQAETLYEWGMTQVAEEVARSKGESSLEAVKARLAAKTFLFGYSTHHILQLRH
jgi:SAM-dependent MidA family methyltransferase